MSFWDGLTRGMKDADAKNQREAAADERRENIEYSRGRDALSDERYAEAQTLAARSTAQANARADAALVENTRRFDLGETRNVERDEIAAASEARAAATFDLGLAQQLGLGGTAAARSTGGGGSGRTPSAQDMNDSVMNLTSELGGVEGLSSMSKEHQTFYQTFLDVPSAAHGLRGFIQAQRKEGNDITMENLPDLINLAGTVEGRGQEDYEAFAAKVAGGADLSDPKVFMEGLEAFQNFSPASVVWDQLDVAQPALNDKDAYGEWFSMLTGAARVAARELEAGDPRIVEIQRAHQKMLNSDPMVKEDGAFDLWDLGVGREQAKGMEDNPFMRAYFPAGTPTPATPSAQPAVVDSVTPVSEPSAATRTFNTTEELNAWAAANPEQAANLNEVTVAGQVLTKGGNTTEVPSPAADEKSVTEFVEIINNPNVGQDVKDMVMKEYSDTYGFTATREAVASSFKANQVPAESADTSMQDSQDLVAIMEDPQVDPGMLQEAIRAFEEKYGVGSSEAAIEMIKKSQ